MVAVVQMKLADKASDIAVFRGKLTLVGCLQSRRVRYNLTSRFSKMHPQPQVDTATVWPASRSWLGRTALSFALLSLFLTAIPVRSFRMDFSPHRVVRANGETQKRLSQASDACRYSAPVGRAVPAPPVEPVVQQARPDVPVVAALFDRSCFNRPPPLS